MRRACLTVRVARSQAIATATGPSMACSGLREARSRRQPPWADRSAALAIGSSLPATRAPARRLEPPAGMTHEECTS